MFLILTYNFLFNLFFKLLNYEGGFNFFKYMSFDLNNFNFPKVVLLALMFTLEIFLIGSLLLGSNSFWSFILILISVLSVQMLYLKLTLH